MAHIEAPLVVGASQTDRIKISLFSWGIWYFNGLLIYSCSPAGTFLFVFGENTRHYSRQYPLLFPYCWLPMEKVPAVVKSRKKECFSVEGPPPTCQQKVKHLQFDLEWPWPQTSQTKLNWCPGSKISIFHDMTLTLTQWPWYWSRCITIPKTTKTLPLPHTREVTIIILPTETI